MGKVGGGGHILKSLLKFPILAKISFFQNCNSPSQVLKTFITMSVFYQPSSFTR